VEEASVRFSKAWVGRRVMHEWETKVFIEKFSFLVKQLMYGARALEGGGGGLMCMLLDGIGI
jgi:hypothetical protein